MPYIDENDVVAFVSRILPDDKADLYDEAMMQTVYAATFYAHKVRVLIRSEILTEKKMVVA